MSKPLPVSDYAPDLRVDEMLDWLAAQFIFDLKRSAEERAYLRAIHRRLTAYREALQQFTKDDKIDRCLDGKRSHE